MSYGEIYMILESEALYNGALSLTKSIALSIRDQYGLRDDIRLAR